MTISFDDVSNNLRIPFVAVEFDATKASQGPALLSYTALLIGQKTSAGGAADNSIHKVTSADDLIALAGRGSMLHRMAIAWFESNTQTALRVGVLADNGAGVANTGTITVTDEDPSAPGATAGTLVLYLGGERLAVAVAEGDDQDAVATAIAAAITAELDLPITAAAVDNVVTWTYRHKGVVGNYYDVRDSFNDGESVPAGIDVAYANNAIGATNPTLTSLVTALGDVWYQIIGHPYTDATSLTAIEAEMSSRNGSTRMIDGLAITAATDSHSNLTTLGDGRNSQHSVIMAQPGTSPLTPPNEFAAEVAAIVARYAAADPARPFQTLPMVHAVPPVDTDEFTKDERNLLLYDGIGTTRVQGTQVVLDRVITTYQTNPSGAADTAYLDATTLLTLLYLRYSFRARMQTRYPRHKLADDGTRFGAGQAIITPKIGKGEAVSWFRQMEELGLVEGFDQFKADLVVERNGSDPNRLDFLLPPDLINGLIVTAAKIQFRL